MSLGNVTNGLSELLVFEETQVLNQELSEFAEVLCFYEQTDVLEEENLEFVFLRELFVEH